MAFSLLPIPAVNMIACIDIPPAAVKLLLQLLVIKY
jgi:hypothetical protein